jgi:L-seryl-tRNA(Ser) seleniumtransferase
VALPGDDPTALAARLRRTDPPVIARIEDDRVLLDLRTVPPSQDAELVDLVLDALT